MQLRCWSGNTVSAFVHASSQRKNLVVAAIAQHRLYPIPTKQKSITANVALNRPSRKLPSSPLRQWSRSSSLSQPATRRFSFGFVKFQFKSQGLLTAYAQETSGVLLTSAGLLLSA